MNKVKETNPFDLIIEETHNPMDIPWGHEVHEINKNVKDQPTEEGGMGSGRQPDYGDPVNQGAQPGELITFETVSIPGSASGISIGGKPHKLEETIMKQLVDEKLKCPCKNTKNRT